ncbi:unnamed protein product [Effrenium voratum]|uniref:Protein kinase domain-containing protein n=1 Tax=Effrenium voratum TaxID=2562239 RepID=A0AA36HY53_9DINO|nr:unnamed protein product [Effrenium voratum]
MLRSSSMPTRRAPEPLKFADLDVASPKDQPHTANAGAPRGFRHRPVPSLDGGRSPFAGRKEQLRLPTLLLSRSAHLGEEEDKTVTSDKTPTPTVTPTPRTRRVGFASGPGTPSSLTEKRAERTRKEKKPSETMVRSKSQAGREKTVLFWDEEGCQSRAARRPVRRQRTWTGTATEASTPSCVSYSPSSTPASPESACSERRGPLWTKGASIGTGSHGCVYKALDTLTGKIFAVKQGIVDDGNDEDRKYRERLEGELTICKDLRHPNIVETLGFEYAKSHLYIYLEYVPGGSMSSILHEFGALTGDLLTRSTCGVLQGLNYLHTREPPVVHRDIKGANILVDVNFTVKLSDFGCSKRSSVTTSFTTIGSIPWMAPEVIQQQDGHGRKADIWSLGCVLLEMATAEKPWGNGAFENVMFALRHIAMSDKVPAIPASLNEAGHDFASSCLKRDADARPTASDLLGHAFVSAS